MGVAQLHTVQKHDSLHDPLKYNRTNATIVNTVTYVKTSDDSLRRHNTFESFPIGHYFLTDSLQRWGGGGISR